MSEDKKDDEQSEDDDGLPSPDTDLDDTPLKIQFSEYENKNSLKKSGLNKHVVDVSGVTDKIDSKE